MAYIFQQIAREGKKLNLKPGRISTRDWFRDRAMEVNKISTSSLMSEQPTRLRRRIDAESIGSMYMFFYEAKHRKTLKYWDRFPLVFPMEIYKDGFLGCNLHYLPPILRARLMDAFYSIRTNDKFDASTKIAMSYNVLSSSSKYKYFRPTIHRYLTSQYKSRFLYIRPDEWDIALMLPTQRFAGDTQMVWKDSRNKIILS